MRTVTFNSATSIVGEKGFGSQTWNVKDENGDSWSVSFNVSFEGLDGDAAVTEGLGNDPTANRSTYNEV